MKKLISFMLIAISAIMLSSCIINIEEPKYTIYFNNDSDTQYIYDWYVKDSSGNNYTLSKEYCPIPQRGASSIGGLREGDYQVWFCVYSNAKRDTDVYVHPTTFVHLNADVTYSLRNDNYTYGRPRSALNEETEAENFVLVDSNGNTFELVSGN